MIFFLSPHGNVGKWVQQNDIFNIQEAELPNVFKSEESWPPGMNLTMEEGLFGGEGPENFWEFSIPGSLPGHVLGTHILPSHLIRLIHPTPMKLTIFVITHTYFLVLN